MGLNILYTLKEGISGFKKAQLLTFLSILTIFISLTFLGLFLIAATNGVRIMKSLRARIDLEVFLDESLHSGDVERLGRRIRGLKGVKRARFISKEEAAEEFKAEFGEDILEVLGENPLPSSFRVELEEGYRSTEAIEGLSKVIEGMEGVEEVVYHKRLINLLERYINIALIAYLVLGAIVGVASVVLVSNTIRATIFARREVIEIMKLVGATDGFIRRPFLVEGMTQGVLGGILAAGFLLLFIKGMQFLLSDLILLEKEVPLLIIVLGGLLGLIGSRLSLNRYLR